MRSYLINAVYAWIIDNELTPYILIDVSRPHVNVPMQYAVDNQIVLNIAPAIVHKLELGKNAISFQARFQGIAHNIYAPNSAVMAIYAKENGRGMFFSEEDEQALGEADDDVDSNPTESSSEPSKTERPFLRIVKKDDDN